MRRLLAAVLIVLATPLLAAAPSNVFYSKPTVIVYPFTANGSSIDREASSRLATIIATQMANTGKVTVAPPPPGTERKDYLTVARSHNADYYVAGYISPLGTGVSVVEQVVSVTTGIVVFSQSTQLATYAEAAGQGDDLAAFISSHANRGLAAIPTPPPQASPTPAPSSGPEANLGKLFGRRKKPAATPSPKPAAATSAPKAAAGAPVPTAAPTARAAAAAPVPAAAPSAEYAVLPVDGPADAAVRELALARLVAATHGERAATLAAACAGHAPKAVLIGILAVKTVGQDSANALFELQAKDCAGKLLWQQSHADDAGGMQAQQVATSRAVDAAVGAYLHPPKRRRR